MRVNCHQNRWRKLPNISNVPSLWTPGGEVSLQQRGRVDITRQEIVTFSHLAEMHNKYGIVPVCQKCGNVLQGKNNASDTRTLSVSCGCREFVYTSAR